MNLDVPFDKVMRTGGGKRERPAGVDYAMADVPVEREMGRKPIMVPVQTRRVTTQPLGDGRHLIQALLRLPGEAGGERLIELRDIYQAPVVHFRQHLPCPQGHPLDWDDHSPQLEFEDNGAEGELVRVTGTMVCGPCRSKWQESLVLGAPEGTAQAALESGKLELDPSKQVESRSQPVEFIPLARHIQEQPFGQFPMLHWASNALRDELEAPFAGTRAAFVLHFLTDLLPFAQACQQLGLEPDHAVFFVKTHYPYPQKEAIRRWMAERGFQVRAVEEAAAYLDEQEAAFSPESRPLLIVEDGGYLTPEIHRRTSPLLARTIGAVEQTTKGLRATEQLGQGTNSSPDLDSVLGFPLLSIPDSRIKTRIEPPLIGNEVVRCIQDLTPLSLHGAHVALLGLGTIGMEVFRHLKNLGAVVTGFDARDESRRAEFMMEGGLYAATPVEAVRGKRLVIGCSGKESITSDVIENLRHGVHVASASSDRVEIDWRYLEQRAVEKTRFGFRDAEVEPGKLWAGTRYRLSGMESGEVNLAADGYPVTFWGAPGMPHEGGDLIMTVILVAAAELSARNGPRRAGQPYPNRICRREVDELGEKYKLQSQHLKLYYPESRAGA